MKVRVPDYYNSFSCLGDKCPDTCCVGWQVEIDEKSYERFKSNPEIMANVELNEEGNPVFKFNELGRCAFLNENNLCDMYIKCGPDSLCSLCDNYPRIGEEFGRLRELGLSISCPEVARIILNHKEKIAYEEWENDEDCQGDNLLEDDVFITLLNLREIAVMNMQKDHYDIFERIKILVVMAARLQNDMDNNDFEDMIAMEDEFCDHEYLEKVIESFGAINRDNNPLTMDAIWEVMSKLDYISKEFVDILNEEHKGAINVPEYIIENLCVYLILRYFMKIINDGDIYGKVVFLATTIKVILELSRGYDSLEDLIKIVYLYSKEVEHCQENMDIMYDAFWEEPFSNPANVIGLW